MKRETLRHPKTLDLSSRLDISRPQALGHLMLLWDWTADVALAGDVGKWPDGAIARACDWIGNAEQFVTALFESGWVDRDEQYRLVIHDWAQHCENWVRAKAEKLGVTLLGQRKSGSYERDSRAGHKNDSLPRDQTNPNQSELNQSVESNKPPSKPRRVKTDGWTPEQADIPRPLDTPEFRVAFLEFAQHRVTLKKPVTELAARKLLKQLEPFGAISAIAKIDKAIASGWQGVVFEDISPASPNRHNGTARTPRQEIEAHRQRTGGKRT